MTEIPISIGELIDKLSVLQVKKNKIYDDSKLCHINKEFDLLYQISSKFFNDEILLYYQELIVKNTIIWEVEDSLRVCENKNIFDGFFIENARMAYKTNDERFRIKNKINEITNSEIREQKNHQELNNYEKFSNLDKWIYESPDGGKTVYKRRFGFSHNTRELIINS